MTGNSWYDVGAWCTGKMLMLLTWKMIHSHYKQCFTVALQGTGLQALISESFPKLLQLFPYHLTVCLLQSKNKTIRIIISDL